MLLSHSNGSLGNATGLLNGALKSWLAPARPDGERRPDRGGRAQDCGHTRGGGAHKEAAAGAARHE